MEEKAKGGHAIFIPKQPAGTYHIGAHNKQNSENFIKFISEEVYPKFQELEKKHPNIIALPINYEEAQARIDQEKKDAEEQKKKEEGKEKEKEKNDKREDSPEKTKLSERIEH